MRGVQHGTNKPLRRGKGGHIFADNAHPAFQIQFCLTTTKSETHKTHQLNNSQIHHLTNLKIIRHTLQNTPRPPTYPSENSGLKACN